MPATRLRLSIDTSYDWLACHEFGFVDDGVPLGAWQVVVDELVALVKHPHTGAIAGFTVLGWTSFDATEHDQLFDPERPRFAVPQLGLTDAGVGEICLATRAWLADEPTLDRHYFHQAMAATPVPAKAIELWLLCLEAGGLEAHYGLVYTLLRDRRLQRAYRHLRAYTELAPWNGWAWCWYAKACMAAGEVPEAHAALAKAIEIEEDGGHETEAAELLDELRAA